VIKAIIRRTVSAKCLKTASLEILLRKMVGAVKFDSLSRNHEVEQEITERTEAWK
jgi:hypothetical protein